MLYATAFMPEDETFNCNAEVLYSLPEALKNWAREYGWDKEYLEIMPIPEDPADGGTIYTLLLIHHGKITF